MEMESCTVTLPVSDAGAEIDSTRSSINFKLEVLKQLYRDLKTTIVVFVESCYRSSIRCFTRTVAAGDETDSVRSLINFKEMIKQRYRDLKTIVESCYRSLIRCFTKRVAAGDETDSVRSLIKFKEMIEQNPDLKTIAAYFYSVLIPGFKSKVAAVVEKIDCLLATAGSLRLAVISNCNLEELDLETVAGGHDNDWPNLIRDDLDPHLVNQETMAAQIRRQLDRISNLRRSVDRRRRGYNATITITVVIFLVGSAWLRVNMEGPAAVVLNTLALVIKAVETWVNVILSEEERMLKEDEEVVKMMRDGEWLMVHEFDDVQQQAKTLNEEIMAEHSKLAEHIQRMEKLEMVKTIVEIECRLKALKRIVRGYGNNVRQFFLKFSAMVIN